MELKTGIVYHDRFLAHDTGPGHPESAERLAAVTKHLKKIKLWQQLQHLLIEEAREEWLLQVHSREYLGYLRLACTRDLEIIDGGDTHISKESYDAALLAAGGVLAAVDAVMNDVLENVFCAVRPPGHHAERGRGMGFCLLNNVSIAARYAQRKYRAERIAIIDWDVHHGNGTQNIFYDDNSVLYISTHQYPFYPGTGDRSERGTGPGEGYTLNIPMCAGSGENEFMKAFEEEVIPCVDAHRPDLILISAGFDAHRDDPLAHLNLTENSYGMLTRLLAGSAKRHCKGRIISVLEGGYNLDALARSVETHIKELMR